jgi:hypothetical protein
MPLVLEPDDREGKPDQQPGEYQDRPTRIGVHGDPLAASRVDAHELTHPLLPRHAGSAGPVLRGASLGRLAALGRLQTAAAVRLATSRILQEFLCRTKPIGARVNAAPCGRRRARRGS